MVPRRGLEPPHPEIHAPEACASTNSATSAQGGYGLFTRSWAIYPADTGLSITSHLQRSFKQTVTQQTRFGCALGQLIPYALAHQPILLDALGNQPRQPVN